MARAIVRYSLQTGERYSTENHRRQRATNAMREILTGAGFVSVGTAAWEGTGSNAEVLLIIERVVAAVREHAPEMLDHLWLYADASS